ncbi:polysaccharide deacetylase family protein [Clostridium septicum]|uniref:Polysaccharide deacetylase n=1 Tax=Clostridium septicum TaxID=1504 RepID=A0A9N7PJU8_CLOSE|nr:polysaccharide deacetylase family protein [Clostridium septicum]AYE35186.1 polysaccharide deacetylase [Clostridium septicum]MDU1313145.1 polysaccharide deacetylase family protein [Clostridium septicum]QAS60589.1 polysaccharide deacetylase [Clostridium septicum]UEC20164.1 polysaccharide deacetylase [Clostridium septicum]USS01781.1 polysaccharide deacetylase [Clostridium septicum]
MKNKLKCFLFLSVNILLIISIFTQSINAVPMSGEATSTEENDINENEKIPFKKEVYLTFDDGPSCRVTDNVLDILKENDVKATFFLIGNQIMGKEEVVKRINAEGHSIGLHTFNHKFKYVYSSEDKFIEEMNDCREEINRVVGISPSIIRFPGGSYKHLSKKYLKRLHENDFKVYDWNVDSTDGMNPNLPADKIYRKAIKVNKDSKPTIILMHCTDLQKNTPKALPEIIKYYKDKGYEFKTITEDTKEMYFNINK